MLKQAFVISTLLWASSMLSSQTLTPAREHAFKADQWNRYQITVGDHLVVELDGETTLDIHDTRFAEGHLRLQYQQFPIAFRNIKIRSLPQTMNGG